MKTQQLLHSNKSFVWHPYRQSESLPNLHVKKTKGNYIYLQNGVKLLDAISSWWSACHGYCHPQIIKAIQKQTKTLSHIMFSGFSHNPAYILAQKLCKFLNADVEGTSSKVFFTDSGSVAIEVAIKIAFQYYTNQGVYQGLDGKNKILSFYGNYHGDTLGAMSVSGCNLFAGKFENFTIKHLKLHLPQNETNFAMFESFLQANENQICAVLIEPLLQGAGGMLLYSVANLQKLCQIVKKYNVLLIFDECATGFYRTGKKFAFHHLQGIYPNIITLSKALTAGHIGLGACVVDDLVFGKFNPSNPQKCFMHGPTFMANPLACVAAIESLNIFENPKINYETKIKQIEQMFMKNLHCLKTNKIVKQVRVFGAMACVEIYDKFEGKSGEKELHSPIPLEGQVIAEAIDLSNPFMEQADARVIDLSVLRAKFVELGVWIRPIYTIHGTIAIYCMPPFTITPRQILTICSAIKNVVNGLQDSASQPHCLI